MAHRRNRRKRSTPSVLLPVVAVLAVAAAVGLLLSLKKPSGAEEAALRTGLNYLTQLEDKDPETVRQARRALHKQRMEVLRDDLTQKVRAGQQDPFPLFHDYAVLGDSRAVGFYYHGFLEESRVLAEPGNTILSVDDSLEALQTAKPSYVYLCYGLNDITIGLWGNKETFAESCVKQVQKIRDVLPEATVVVSSILPITEPADEKEPKWLEIPQWNTVLEAACRENGILYADCDWVFYEHSDRWEEDGHHLRAEVYPYWGGQLLITALYGGIADES